jgi:hypothetical protein
MALAVSFLDIGFLLELILVSLKIGGLLPAPWIEVLTPIWILLLSLLIGMVVLALLRSLPLHSPAPPPSRYSVHRGLAQRRVADESRK